MRTHNLCFEQKYEKYQKFLSENFHFFDGKIFNKFEEAYFCNDYLGWIYYVSRYIFHISS